MNQIKWAYQRVVRGYDDRIFWSFSEYFEQFIPPLKRFCEQWLKEEYTHLNPIKHKVILETLRLIYLYETTESTWDERFEELMEYVGKNIGYYWH